MNYSKFLKGIKKEIIDHLEDENSNNTWFKLLKLHDEERKIYYLFFHFLDYEDEPRDILSFTYESPNYDGYELCYYDYFLSENVDKPIIERISSEKLNDTLYEIIIEKIMSYSIYTLYFKLTVDKINSEKGEIKNVLWYQYRSPIISMLAIIFLALVNVNILIGLENNFKSFKNLNNTKEKLFVFIKMFFKSILFLFFLANSVILYTKL